MLVTRLDIRNLRCVTEASLRPVAGLNLITGENGAGKTSLLEGLHLMAYGRSFRGRVRDGLVRSGQPALEVFVEWQEQQGARVRRAGLQHGGAEWQGRLDGAEVAQLGELCAALAVVSFEPGSHALVSGGGEPRRRFVDWGLFHVEPEFLPYWRRYSRALKQRNALLKSGAGGRQLDAWDTELAESGETLTRRRQEYLERLQPQVQAVAADLVPSLGRAWLDFQPGWRRQELSLADALLLVRQRDLQSGFTSVGPHRADWRIGYAARPGQEPLSRGQAKLTALSCLLAQAEDYAAQRGEWPVMALDDLASELDRRHQLGVLRRLRAGQAQVFMTGTEPPVGLGDEIAPDAVFHVELGQVSVLGAVATAANTL
ncbi:DNA replication/repair protein RecF [Pseudoxanthomonas kalamensis DSM 18571]|uniref:DNA replication/repair protein RecF n=1 Tax=Pseudoxanthomonas kalamensis TaxID=289483 RepID=UPI001391439C|nr:DNA replication/repair protein RecF [Pseudoxanthomonas kalamensis]KAF1712329.1 DNA replication/repair protein RecF [Pseudoxanthomonas kalamensis DSM 18571]